MTLVLYCEEFIFFQITYTMTYYMDEKINRSGWFSTSKMYTKYILMIRKSESSFM
jgi:hypothetical protein